MASAKKVDPIPLLRESFTEHKPIICEGNHLVFWDKSVLKLDTPTAWAPPDKTKRYTVGDLWLYLTTKAEKKPNTEYYNRIAQFKKVFPVQLISFQHHGDLNRRNRPLFLRGDGPLRLHRRVAEGGRDPGAGGQA